MAFMSPVKRAASMLPAGKPTPPPKKEGGSSGIKIEAKELIPNLFGGSGEGVSEGINDSLVPTLFESGAKDEALAVDVYGTKNNNVMNRFADNLKQGLKPILKNGKGSLIDQVKSTVKSAIKNRDINALKSLKPKELLKSAFGDKAALVNTLKESGINAFAGALGKDPEFFKKIYADINGVQHAFKTGDMSGLLATAGLIENWGTGFLGNNTIGGMSFTDIGAKAGIFRGIVTSAINHDLGGAMNQILDQAPNLKVKIATIRDSFNLALEKGDMASLKAFASHLSPSAIRGINANAVPQMAANFTIPLDTKSSEYTNRWTEVKGLMSSLDAGWNQHQRGERTYSSLKVFTSASPDFLKLASTEPAFDRQIRLSSLFKGLPIPTQPKVMTDLYNRSGVVWENPYRDRPASHDPYATVDQETGIVIRHISTRRTGGSG